MEGCADGEMSVTVDGIDGGFCSPACDGMMCPPAPDGVGAMPQCVLVLDMGMDPTNCALICQLSMNDADCPQGSTCKDIGQMGAGICTFP